MPLAIRPFERRDREQLTALVNLHVAAVIPGIALSTNVVLSQLEREPGETIVDPWVAERVCLVAVRDDAIVAATLVHRFGRGSDVRDGYRGAAEIRWFVAEPAAAQAGADLLDAAVALMRTWEPTHIYADGTLPAPGCYGTPSAWPHIQRLFVGAGFGGDDHRFEHVLAVHCNTLASHHPSLLQRSDVRIARSVGRLGVRLDLLCDDDSLGYIEVGEIRAALTRSTTGATWTDVGNLFPTSGQSYDEVMPALFTAAARWLRLGGVDRLIDYYADDVDPPGYLAILLELGFERLTINRRGWTLPV